MPFDDLVSAFVTLFVIVDPLGMAPIFLAVTRGMSPGQRRRIALESTLVSLGIIAGAALIGEWLLEALGIGIPAFRIAGGILLFVIGFEMLFERRQERKADNATDAAQDRQSGVAIFPLAIPLMAGPGAVTAAVLLAGAAEGDAASLASLIGVIAVVIAIVFVVFLLAPAIERVFGQKAQSVLARLLGILLAALAVQFIVDGIREAFAIGA